MVLSDRHFMEIATVISSAGTCTRLQVGALIVRDRRIIATGYNGAPAGIPHCIHLPSEELARADSPTLFQGDDGCSISVHAEANAIAFAAKHGISIEKADLFTTDSPCEKCAQLIVNTGIRRIVYARPYRKTGGIDLLLQAGLKVEQYSGPNVSTVPTERGYGEGMHPGEHADPSFIEAFYRGGNYKEGKHQAGGNW